MTKMKPVLISQTETGQWYQLFDTDLFYRSVDFCPISTLDVEVEQLVNTFTPADTPRRAVEVPEKETEIKMTQNPRHLEDKLGRRIRSRTEELSKAN